MPRQQLDLDTLVIPKGKRESNCIRLHGDATVLTIYAPKLTGQAAVQVTSDGEKSCMPYVHKGAMVKLASGMATDVPIPACKMLRVASTLEEEEERTFHVLELLEM